MSDNIIWILLFFVFLIIIGLYVSEFTPVDLDKKESILKLKYITENFNPIISTTDDQGEGSSELYNWPLPDDTTYTEPACENTCNHTCNETCQPECPQKCPPPPKQECVQPKPPPKPDCPVKKSNESCYNCDIIKNKDIDKYVLKSSVPSCPDMSEYITKNMMNAHPDLKDYILKSEIKPCEKIDTSQYILKSQIPACPSCPICPECPICPVCPPPQKCKEINEYNITEHPNLKDYISNLDLNEKYMLKNDCKYSNPNLKDYISKKELNEKYMLKNDCKYSNPSNPSNPNQPNQPSNPNQPNQPSNQPNLPSQPSQPKLPNIHTPSDDNSVYEDVGKYLDLQGFYAGDSLFAGV